MKKTCIALLLLISLVGFVSYAGAGAWDPVWSPDGSKIAFTCDYGGSTNIWIANADGSNPIQLTDHPFTDWDPDWTPDGSKILFSHDRDGDRAVFNVWSINTDGSSPTQVTFGNDGWETAAVEQFAERYGRLQ